MNAPFHALLLALLIALCALVELHPRVRTGCLASLTIGTLAIAAWLRLTLHAIHGHGTAPLLEYIATAAAILALYRYARHRIRAPGRHPHAGPINHWHITP